MKPSGNSAKERGVLGRFVSSFSSFTNVLARIVTGGSLGLFIAITIFIAPFWFFCLALGVFICLGLYEFFTMLKKKGIVVYRLFGIVIGAAIPVVVSLQLGFSRSGEVLFIVLACFSLFLLQFLHKDNPRALEGISLTFFGIMYISWFLSFIIRIRFFPGGDLWVAYLLVVTKGADVGAYVGGSLWGRHTLVPHISPRKSVEGTVAGILASALLSVSFYDILPLEFSRLHLLVIGLLMGLVGQCGDLSESLIKRYCSVKDSGRRLPGFGGFLDTMDSVLFTSPLFYFYLLSMGY